MRSQLQGKAILLWKRPRAQLIASKVKRTRQENATQPTSTPSILPSPCWTPPLYRSEQSLYGPVQPDSNTLYTLQIASLTTDMQPPLGWNAQLFTGHPATLCSSS